MMLEHMLSDSERDLLKVIKNEIDYAQDTPSLAGTQKVLDASIAESEALLRSLGRGDELEHIDIEGEPQEQKKLVIRSFDDLLKDANERYPGNVGFGDIFGNTEIQANREYILQLNAEFDAVHKLDAVDVIIPVVAGILSGAVDCVFGGFVRCTDGRNVPGTMSEFVRKLFDKALPAERIKKLEDFAKVPYDALNYDNTVCNWCIDYAEQHFHPIFEKYRPGDEHPRNALIAGRDYLNGKLTFPEAKRMSSLSETISLNLSKGQ